MPSSTSPSRALLPVQALRLLALAACAWIAAAAYTLTLNPEIALYRGAAGIKQTWARKMTREHGAKTVIYGGSSCSFSVAGERLLDHDALPVANMGLHAGMGSLVLTRWALSEVRPGDTLIVALEPFLLTDPQDPSTFDIGVQFSVAMHSPEWSVVPYGDEPDHAWFPRVAALRPGGYHFFTMLGKLAAFRPLYRYTLADFDPSGWQQTSARYPIDGPSLQPSELSSHTIRLLHWLGAWCAKNEVRIAYSLPWSYAPPETVPRFRAQNIALLLQVAQHIPVLRDEALGVDTHVEHFTDGPLHLDGHAAALRSDELAREIKTWSTWSAAELESLLSNSGSNEAPPPK